MGSGYNRGLVLSRLTTRSQTVSHINPHTWLG
jgi:hypothetical protein